MIRLVILADEAVHDLASIYGRFTQPGAGRLAQRQLQAIESSIRNLSAMPYLGRDGRLPGTRELPIRGYVVVYELVPDTGDGRTAGTVLVTAIYGPGQGRP